MASRSRHARIRPVLAATFVLALALVGVIHLAAQAPGSAGSQVVVNTDPALRLKGFAQHETMAAASPFKDVKWQWIGPKNISGRSHRHRRRRSARQELHGLRRHRVGRPVEDGERGDHLAAGLRARAGDDDRRRHDRPVQPEHRLDRDRRGEHLPQLPGRHRRLQVGGRGQDLAAHGARRHLHDPADRHPPDQPRHRLRGRVGPRVDHQRRARRLQDDRRREDVGEGALRQREDRGDRPGHGPGRPEHALRGHVAAHAPEVERPAQHARHGRQRHPQVRRTAARPGSRSTRGCRFRGSGGASASTSACRRRTRCTPSWTTTRSRASRPRKRRTTRTGSRRAATSRAPRSTGRTTRASTGRR